MDKLKKTLIKLVLFIAFLIGFGYFSYPTVSDWLAKRNQINAIQSYDRHITSMSKGEIAYEWGRAEDYNRRMQNSPVTDPFSNVELVEPFTEYDTILDIDGIMGYLEIPSIEVNMPIYHGVSDDVLKKGVGHIKATSLPIGGERNHAVLSAHSGLPEAKLFTDLEKLKEGEYFFIYVLDKKLAYRIDQLLVIEPDDISELVPVDGKDYVTLLTCTPIGVNSHRYLVRGERCDIPSESEYGNPRQMPLAYLIIIVILILFLIFIVIWKKSRRRKRRLEDAKNEILKMVNREGPLL